MQGVAFLGLCSSLQSPFPLNATPGRRKAKSTSPVDKKEAAVQSKDNRHAML